MDQIGLLKKAVLNAGNELMEKYFQKEFEIGTKSDGSIISAADFAAEKAIRKVMIVLEDTGVPIRSEEVKENETFRLFVKNSKEVYIADPLDGSREFTKGLDQFCISLGLISDGTPIKGAVYAPARNKLYFAEKGKGAYVLDTVTGIEKRIFTSDVTDFDKMTVLLSSNELIKDRYPEFCDNLERLGYEKDDPRIITLGSTTLKTAMIAHGVGDYYFTFTAWDHKKQKLRITKEWDIAATYLFVTEAGGMMTDCLGNEFVFGKQDPKNYYGIFASNSKENHYKLLEHVTKGIDFDKIKEKK